uniref:Chromosome 1 open reading frame 87 n=1 Tax=Chelonoidis abingdonii TaxID=106734 RepID=A0A8C0JF66_CHEAB
MSSVGNVPNGADAHTETIVKIIGSKYVRCIVEKPKIKAKEGTKVETQSALQKLPACNTRQTHGNPPGFNNPLCQQISYDLDYERRSREKQEEHESKQLQTSNSRFLDGKVLKPPNIHCVSVPSGDQSLSYIHALQKPSLRARCLRQQVGHYQVNIICQGPTESPEEEDSLLALIRNELRLGPVRLAGLEKLQRELKTLHPISRFLPQSQLSSLLLKHEVPLQLPTVKLLFERFSEANDSELVCSSECLNWGNKSINLFQIVFFFYLSMQVNSLAPEDPLQILKQILKEYKGELDMEKLSLSFQKEDKSFSGLLSLNEIETICQKHRLTLTPLLLESLIHTVQSFPLQENTKEHEILASKTWVRNYPTTEIKERPVIQSFFSPTDSSDSEEQEAWIDRFRKLEKDLYLCDIKNTGMLEKEKAKRLIHNYNLIYDLSLSPLKIDQAFRNFRSGENMPLQPVLQYLKEL